MVLANRMGNYSLTFLLFSKQPPPADSGHKAVRPLGRAPLTVLQFTPTDKSTGHDSNSTPAEPHIRT